MASVSSYAHLGQAFASAPSPLAQLIPALPLSNPHEDHSGCFSIPDKYVWPQHLRPTRRDGSASQNELGIPTIDLAGLDGSNRAAIVEEIGRACQEWGFFQIVNHGVPTELMKRVLDVALEFFMLPMEGKMKYGSIANGNFISFGTSFNTAVDDVFSWRYYLRHHSNPIEEFIGVWPDKPASYRDVVSEYCKDIRTLALRLMSAMSESLGVGTDFIARAFDDPKSTQILVLNNYPPCANPEAALGFAAHSDATGFTILQPDDVPGLQIRHNGEWIDVLPIKDGLVINVADQIEILTNGRYKSVEHRALVNATRSRMSIATACGPSLQSVMGPAMEFVSDSERPKYKAAQFSDYLKILFTNGVQGKALLESRKTSTSQARHAQACAHSNVG